MTEGDTTHHPALPLGLDPAQIQASERVLAAGTWMITSGAVLFSVLTVTPLVEQVTPTGWEWTAPILPLVVDTAVVIVVRLEAVVARLGRVSGRWPAVLRWMTGLMTLLLNVGNSALNGDTVGVAVHSVAPLLLIVTAEAARSYRRTIADALESAERSRAEARAACEQQQRQEREREREARERAEREAREHAERMERERSEREAAQRREEREHADRVRREQQEREDRRRREEWERAERLRQERERVRAARRSREPSRPAAVNSTADTVNDEASGHVNAPADGPAKLSEEAARTLIRESSGRSVRRLADDTGWSVGWVSARIQELRGEGNGKELEACAGGVAS